MTNSPESVLIVGATSLMAQHAARRWVAGGATRMRLVGRTTEALERLAADLRVRSAHCLTIDVRVIDLLDPAAITQTIAEAEVELSPTTVLIAHGVMHDPARMRTDLDLAHDQLEVTGVSPALWLEAAVTATGARRIGVIGSVAGDRGRASNYLYGSAKGMVERVAQGLAHRLHGSGRTVTLIKPGPTATPMTSELQAAGARLATAEAVSADIVRGLARGRAVVYAPGIWRWIMLVVRLLPRAVFHRTSL